MNKYFKEKRKWPSSREPFFSLSNYVSFSLKRAIFLIQVAGLAKYKINKKDTSRKWSNEECYSEERYWPKWKSIRYETGNIRLRTVAISHVIKISGLKMVSLRNLHSFEITINKKVNSSTEILNYPSVFFFFLLLTLIADGDIFLIVGMTTK